MGGKRYMGTPPARLGNTGVKTKLLLIVPCGPSSVGRTDAPSCRLLFSRSANEGPGAAESRPNESSRVWARIESWVVQSVSRRTTISPECTGWIRGGGDGNVSELLLLPLLCAPPYPPHQYQVPRAWSRAQSTAHRCRSRGSRLSCDKSRQGVCY